MMIENARGARIGGYTRKQQLHAYRRMGSSVARIDVPMLHPDHIRHAGILLRRIGKAFEAIATERGTNLMKILDARHLIRILNGDLADYATDDIHDDPQRTVWKD
jgi:hypothetical protein